jgi:hypothetical protein
MKKITTILFLVLSVALSAQDEKEEKKVGRVQKDTAATPTYTYDLNDPLVVHYDYQKPPAKKNIIENTEADSTFNLSGAFKFPLTALLANKIGISYEKVFGYKFSWEIQPMYIFANPLYDQVTQSVWPNIAFKNSGFELRFGLNLLDVKTYRQQNQKLHSKGIFISYRYQHADNVDFSTDGKGGQGYQYNYRVSQTKNLIGVFYRSRNFEGIKKTGIETFYEFGFYAGTSRTVCFSYAGSYGDDTGTPMKVQNVGMPFENGFVIIPVLRLGMQLRYNSFKN